MSSGYEDFSRNLPAARSSTQADETSGALGEGPAGVCTGSVMAADPTAMVGRDRELVEVTRLVDAATAGTGGALLVIGEAGIGKSRLLAETVALARSAGFVVLTGRAVPGGGTYRAVAEAVLGHVRESGLRRHTAAAALPRRARQARARVGGRWRPRRHREPRRRTRCSCSARACLQLLIAAGDRAGCLLVLDDLHWADPDTIALVEYVAAAARSSPVLLAVSARDDQPGLSPDPHDSAAGRLAGHGRGHHRPAPSTRRSGGRSCSRRPGPLTVPFPEDVLAALVERAEGLPVLVEELLGGLLDGRGPQGVVPPTLAALVGARIAALDALSRLVVVGRRGARGDTRMGAAPGGHRSGREGRDGRAAGGYRNGAARRRQPRAAVAARADPRRRPEHAAAAGARRTRRPGRRRPDRPGLAGRRRARGGVARHSG